MTKKDRPQIVSLLDNPLVWPLKSPGLSYIGQKVDGKGTSLYVCYISRNSAPENFVAICQTMPYNIESENCIILLIKSGEGTGPMKPRQPLRFLKRCQFLREVRKMGE